MIRSKSKNKAAFFLADNNGKGNRLSWLGTMIGAAVLAFAADRSSKIWILSHVNSGENLPFLPGLLQLELVRNTGAAWSLGRDHAPLMTALACLYTLGFSLWGLHRIRLAKDAAWLERVGAGLIIGASCGNLYERFTVGSVTDFLKFAFINFPIFNLADALIDVGVVFILLQFLFLENNKKVAES